jgi:acyl-CoA reductase-like NAD-dependent aldehyde dehydrogenase
MTATNRGKLILRLAHIISDNAERLAEIEVRDNGKLLTEMRAQLNYHPEWWRYFGGPRPNRGSGRCQPCRPALWRVRSPL